MNFFRKPLALLALAFGAFAGATAKAAEAVREMTTAAPKLEPARQRRHKAKKKDVAILHRSSSKYRAHQGDRECARRRGGLAWINHKAMDRQRRGLPVIGAEPQPCRS